MDYSKHPQIEFRRKYWQIFGASIWMTDLASQLPVGFIKLKAFRLKDDIRIYADEAEHQEVFRIAARQVMGFKRVFDVFDSSTDKIIFSVRQRALKSAFVRDHMELLDTAENLIGDVIETSNGLALARRWIEILPLGDFFALALMFTVQTFQISMRDATGQSKLVGNVVHRKSPFVVRLNLDTSMAETKVDHRIPVASCALITILDAVKNK